MAQEYTACDAIVLPRVGPESFGRVLVEGQAAGLAVVGSDVGGIPETMRVGETGLLVPPGGAEALADTLVALANDSAQRTALGAAGRAWVRATFDAPVVAGACARQLGA